MEHLMEIRNLSVSYFTYAGEIQAVRGISFQVEKKKTLAVVGESGCGKTVTAKALMGLIRKPGKIKDGSQIYYEQEEILSYSKKQWLAFRGGRCSMIFQDALTALNPTMKVGKQIIENLDNHDRTMSRPEKYGKALEMLKLVGIPDAEQCMQKYPHELSGGMRQRVVIAIALVTHPQLLIADEPTTALDMTIQAQILQLLQSLQQRLEMTIILITHDFGVVAEMADEILVMYAGKIVECGECRDIFYHPQHPYTWELLRSIPRIDMEAKEQLLTIEGNLPDMTHPPKGCAFCYRCPYVMDICRICEPPETYCSERHFVFCWLQNEYADKSGVPFDIRMEGKSEKK